MTKCADLGILNLLTVNCREIQAEQICNATREEQDDRLEQDISEIVSAFILLFTNFPNFFMLIVDTILVILVNHFSMQSSKFGEQLMKLDILYELKKYI